MKLEMAEGPNRDQLRMLRQWNGDDAVWMISLLKFRERAVYPDDLGEPASGREAYARYGDALEPIVNAGGGRLVAMGDYRGLFIGSGEVDFDVITIVEFPSSGQWFDILASDAVKAISHHRIAGLEAQLLFLAAPRTSV
jgi:uncharacterized protein (DUF1330 family)